MCNNNKNYNMVIKNVVALAVYVHTSYNNVWNKFNF